MNTSTRKRKKRIDHELYVGTTYLTTAAQRMELRIAAARKGMTMGAAIREAVALWLKKHDNQVSVEKT